MGEHRFAYALIPHAGGWQDGGVVAEARAFNAPLRWGAAAAAAGRGRRSRARPASCSTRSSSPRTPTRSSCASTRRTAGAAARACGSASRSRRRGGRTCSRTTSGPAEVDGDAIVVDFRPWQIVTLLVR